MNLKLYLSFLNGLIKTITHSKSTPFPMYSFLNVYYATLYYQKHKLNLQRAYSLSSNMTFIHINHPQSQDELSGQEKFKIILHVCRNICSHFGWYIGWGLQKKVICSSLEEHVGVKNIPCYGGYTFEKRARINLSFFKMSLKGIFFSVTIKIFS